MDMGQNTYINSEQACTAVRGGGFGSGAWLARITGSHEKFGMARDFVRKDASGLSGSGRSGLIYWSIERPGVYEWRDFCVGSTSKNWRSSGFCVIGLDGAVEEIERDEALDFVEKIEQQLKAASDAE